MKINLTAQQYEALIKIVYMGNGMINSIADEPEENQFDRIEEYLLSLAKNFGFEDYALYDDKGKKYSPSRKLEEDKAVTEYIHRYNDYTFWDKLIFNLARRDMAQEHGEGAVAKMSEEECFIKEQPFAEKYGKEFAMNGLKNLKIEQNK
ncbi:MAG: hypothetical protein C0392_04585 [Syntrophus sp. (in: bacteria)]|nr:hypothetical protein [Syntrophus sp. (in: bacteria)]